MVQWITLNDTGGGSQQFQFTGHDPFHDNSSSDDEFSYRWYDRNMYDNDYYNRGSFLSLMGGGHHGHGHGWHGHHHGWNRTKYRDTYGPNGESYNKEITLAKRDYDGMPAGEWSNGFNQYFELDLS